MCQLLALSCNAPASPGFAFAGFAARGGATAEHSDGFGLAFHAGRSCRVFIDERPASVSPLAAFLQSHPIRARVVLGHIRKATQGAVDPANCHPFVREWGGRHWSFCHQGDLKDFQPRLGPQFRPVGTTDSERAFCWMMHRLSREFGASASPSWQELAAPLARIAAQISRHGTFNFLMSDGQSLFAHATGALYCLRRQHPFPVAQLIDREESVDLSVENRVDDVMTLVATAPLTRNEPWMPFAPAELRVFVDGAQVHRLSTRPGVQTRNAGWTSTSSRKSPVPHRPPDDRRAQVKLS